MPADAEVTADQVRDLVAMTGEARALLRAGEAVTGAHLAAVPGQRAAQAAAFADLPANAVAVRADGVYMTVPGGVGAVERMGHPQFFAADGEKLGEILVSQISRDAEEVSFRVIGKKADDLPRVSGLALWYMAAHSGARRFAVYDIVSERLRRILGRLGMSAVGGWGLDMRGDAEVVARNAAAAAVADGWVLRIPRPETPVGLAGPAEAVGQDAAFADLPANAVAVRADGSYLTVPSGIGVLAGMDHPRLFSRDGQQRGQVRLAGIEESADELTLDEITGAAELSCLAMWYLTAHTAAPQITVTDVVEGRFSGTLASVGMTWSGSEQMTGDTRRVARYAAASASRAGWTVRTPVAVPAVTYVDGPEFAAAVAELEVHLYGDEPPPVPLREVFEYLVGEGRIEEVPTVGELPAVIAGLSGVPVGDVDRAWVDRVLEDLTHEVAGRSQAGSAGPGLPGGRRVMAGPVAAGRVLRARRLGLDRPAPAAVLAARRAVAAARPRVQANDHLLASVNLLLQKWRRPLVGIEDLRRALDESPPINTDHRGIASNIAEYIAFRAATRVRGGAMGAEVERRNIRLLPPAGRVWQGKVVLVESLDGLVKITLDIGYAWRGADDVLYLTEEDMNRAAPHLDAAASGRQVSFTVAEVIAGPWGAGRHSLSAMLDRLSDVEERWERTPATRLYDPPQADRTTLAKLFEDLENPQYKVTAEFRDVQVVRYPGLSGDAPLFVQLSVGVPLGGGVLAALAELNRSIPVPVRPLEEAAHGAMRFGWQVAALYVLYLTGMRGDAQLVEDVAALTLDPDVVSVAEVMALAFIQLSAVLLAMNGFGHYPKMHMALAVRQWLRKIWAELDPQVQRFFAELVGEIRALFEAEFDAWFPRWRIRYNRKRDLRKGAPVDLWALPIGPPLTKAPLGTLGDLFDEILRPDPRRRPIRQEDFEVSPADSGDGLDTSRGSGLPLVVLEMRVMVMEMSGDDPADLPPGTRRWDDFQMLTDRIGRLIGVAEQGEARAEFAHRLAASPQGRSLIASLRQVVLTREAQRDGAIRKLCTDVASYLESFPVQRPELEQALKPVARLGAPSLAQADPDEARTARVVRAVLGSGHQVTDLEIARVVLLARSLGMPLGQVKHWLAGLGRAVWLHDQDFPAGGQVMDSDVTRAFGFLVGAASVFYDADLEKRISLADLVRAAVRAAGGGAKLAAADRQAASPLLDGLGDGMPVSKRQLPELVDLPGDGPVNREQLAARVRRVIEAWARPAGAEGDRDGKDGTTDLLDASVIRSSRRIVWPGQRPVPAKAVLTTEHATGLLAGPGLGSLEQAWAVGHQGLSELAGRLAEQSPDGDVEAISEALARYTRAWRDHAADVETLEEFRGRLDGSSNPLPREQRLEAAVRHAKEELAQARDELAALVADPELALLELALLLARPVGGGLPGAGRGRSGRSEEQPPQQEVRAIDDGSREDGSGDVALPRFWHWQNAVLDLATGELTYGRNTVTLPPSQAAVLAALIDADGQLRTPGQLAETTSYDANSIPSAVSRLRDELGSLPGFRGEITPARQDGGYRLVLSAALPVAQPPPWEGAVLDLATGELRYDGSVLPLPPEQAAVLAVLVGANGQTITPGQLIAGPAQTQNDIRAAVAGLHAALAQLSGFSGRVVTRGIGFRLVSVVAWNGLSLDPTTGELRHGDSTETLPSDEAAVLAALIGADGQLRNSGELGEGIDRAARTVRGVVSRLREVLGRLPGFRGEVIIQDGQAGGYRLVLSAAPPVGQPPPWEGAVLDLATGELRYDGSVLPLPPAQAAVLGALIGAGGQLVTPGQLITGPDQTQNDIRAAVAGLAEALEQLLGFSGRIVARGIGFRLVSVVAWNGLSLDPTTRVLRYGDCTEALLPDEAGVLAALIGAGGQPRTPGQLATAAGLAASTARGAVPGLREVLASLPGFRGEITPAQGPSGGYQLVLSAALVADQEAGGPPPWQGAVLDLATRELRYGGSTVVLLPDEAAVLAALIGAGGKMVTPGQLITGPDQTQNDIHAAVAGLSEALGQLPGFPGRLATQGIGFRLVSFVAWNGLSMDPAIRVLRYRGSTRTLPPDQTAVLAALIDADGQLRNSRQLARITDRSETNMYAAVSRLREVLTSVPGLGGKITNTQGPGGGYRLVLSTGLPAGQDVRAQLASLTASRERLVRIPGDGFCLANALLTAAGGPLAAAGITTPERLHEELATYLEQLQDWGPLEDEARDAWARARAGVGSGPLYRQFYALAGTPAAREEMRAQLVAELRQAGAWNTAGSDLALAVAARRFGLAVTIVYADGQRHQLTDGDFQVTLVRRSAIHWDAAVPDDTPRPAETSRRPASPGRSGPGQESARKRQRTDPGPAAPAAGAAVLAPGAAVLATARVPVFEIDERVDVVDQALRWRVGHAEGAAGTPLHDAEDLRITEWRLREYQLRYDPRIDQQFPWRDPADPLNRVYHPFADPDTGALDPGWTVTAVQTTAPRMLQAMASGNDRRLGRVPWTQVRRALAADVRRLVRAMMNGRGQQPRVIARVLTAGDVLDHEDR